LLLQRCSDFQTGPALAFEADTAAQLQSAEQVRFIVKIEDFGVRASAPGARNETWQSHVAVRSEDVSRAGAKSRRFSR